MTKASSQPPVTRDKTTRKFVFDLALVEKYASQGMSLEQIAQSMGVSRRTLMAHKSEDEALEQAWLKGKAKGIQVVVNALFQKAKKGNVTAQIFFLKNMAGWRDVVTVDDERTTPAPLIVHVSMGTPPPKDVTPTPPALESKS